MTSFSIAIDGASKGNPGAAGIGVVLCDDAGNLILEISEYIGETTNNVAEYTALIRGLEEALKLGAESIRISTDSELLARQIAGIYKVKSPHLAEIYQKAKSLLSQFKDAKIRHVLRGNNAHADKLASEAAQKGAKASKKPAKTTKPKPGEEMDIPRQTPQPQHKDSKPTARPVSPPKQQDSQSQLNLDM